MKNIGNEKRRQFELMNEHEDAHSSSQIEMEIKTRKLERKKYME